ncbi:Cell fate regulator YaaT, PSP1 superfamily (controls sporulation, competence, biofilm development) [Peptoclostridium litorale DSM 5388]|uniref:Signal peptidase-like protein n=1 Tax=Peptoclostridium litorale DSM 5388 TaxID=1121324 RepID=A0A069RB60_PEPLI|nr:stage 0 sporulation family protein [Peptoclostridium litorale]KDR94266.1 signal peptidase-like protein [Peptoclostridium litorale DSM 5388]SIO28292.1 Cell fate regulator YaaT, PSP1 superfamily (controls sporulation, competence, biofilm development) [Peptoclostridium litorale DSM 5388]
MIKVVGVRFKKAGKIYYFDPQDFKPGIMDSVIVETVRGLEFGTIAVGIKEVSKEEIVSSLKPIIRIATDEDLMANSQNKEDAKKAFDVCCEKIQKHELDMYLIDSEYTFDRNKLIFYFTADGRVDFRELVKDLAAVFKTRIELRQIGVRDEAKSIGGLGCCGRPLCCSTWLGDFQPVSIKMAKDQNLSLNPTKISGVCGRLFCCLNYEHSTYENLIDKMPPVNSKVITPLGKGIVVSTELIKEELSVSVEGEDDIKKFYIHEVKVIEKAKRGKLKSEEKMDRKLEKELRKLEKDK